MDNPETLATQDTGRTHKKTPTKTQNTTQHRKLKRRPHQKPWDEPRCLRRVCRSCPL